ncbi:hypothetical protein Tco_1292620, partial [Tanacetum coccineum]
VLTLLPSRTSHACSVTCLCFRRCLMMLASLLDNLCDHFHGFFAHGSDIDACSADDCTANALQLLLGAKQREDGGSYERVVMSLSGLDKGMILRILAWNPTTVAAMADACEAVMSLVDKADIFRNLVGQLIIVTAMSGVSSLFNCLPVLASCAVTLELQPALYAYACSMICLYLRDLHMCSTKLGLLCEVVVNLALQESVAFLCYESA